jgi:hypothetical protein
MAAGLVSGSACAKLLVLMASMLASKMLLFIANLLCLSNAAAADALAWFTQLYGALHGRQNPPHHEKSPANRAFE